MGGRLVQRLPYLVLFGVGEARSFARAAASSSGVGSVVDMMRGLCVRNGQSIAVEIPSPKSLEDQQAAEILD